MIVIGAENFEEKLKSEPHRQHKALLNETGIVIFPVSVQHSTVKAYGLSYEDDSKGNALAVIFDGRKFEIRGHRDFTADRVKLIVERLWQLPELAALKDHTVTYQGTSILRC